MGVTIAINLTLVALLIAATAYFVITEFAVIRVRSSRIDQLIMEGNKRAFNAKKVITNLDGSLSACQLGITITALGLGSLGEPTMELLLHPVFEAVPAVPEAVASILSYVLAFVIITYLHVVVGELFPKTVAIQKAEAVTLAVSGSLLVFYKVMYPFIWLLNGSANQIGRLIGMKPASEHGEAFSEEELRLILNESYEGGQINQSEYGYVSRIFAFDEMLANEIMVPRTDMACLYLDKSREENRRIILQEQYTRFPVADSSKDNIVGMINTKQYFLALEENPDLDVASLVHPVMSVSETMAVKDLLKKMQKENTHIAILVDEYGGTSGMVTIEDILEEIVGDIRDEFDAAEEAELVQVSDDHLIVDGKVFIHRINEILMTDLDDEELNTIGGWLYGHKPDLIVGHKWQYENLEFTVLRRGPRRYRKLEIVRHPVVPDENIERSALDEEA
ncbi:hemolysin family protein [Saccharibacillus alkalitolerans]|uniref:HlyC/CorC family transporter n=1 Tax=Saccharibacillus alkalitolerans TaxID=2705290 RepID=A0ABX0FEG1_9BACL|nr:hemolysin family protein [Saccharibacillus alkalitolerans]NGZ78222.1 HlyC/CorC family transporter [Saccharibacillus alkalitolerans]